MKDRVEYEGTKAGKKVIVSVVGMRMPDDNYYYAILKVLYDGKEISDYYAELKFYDGCL